MFRGDRVPACMLLRDVLMEENTYEGAVKRLQHTKLMAAIYFMIVGNKPY